jgi:hypothetical protein
MGTLGQIYIHAIQSRTCSAMEANSFVPNFGEGTGLMTLAPITRRRSDPSNIVGTNPMENSQKPRKILG